MCDMSLNSESSDCVSDTSNKHKRGGITIMKIRSLLPYLAITCGLAWGLIGLLMQFPQQITAVFGELSAKNPLFIFADYAPAIAAFILVFRHVGLQGLRLYLSRLLLWKVL